MLGADDDRSYADDQHKKRPGLMVETCKESRGDGSERKLAPLSSSRLADDGNQTKLRGEEGMNCVAADRPADFSVVHIYAAEHAP